MKTIYLSDMSRSLPGSAIAAQGREGAWLTRAYESGVAAGIMLCSAGRQVPDVRLPLDQTGWHAIHIGVIPHWSVLGGGSIRVKLTGDPCFVTIRLGGQLDKERFVIKEVFFKNADITGQELIFCQEGDINLAYVKLEELSDEEVKEIRPNHSRDHADEETRRLFAMNDGSFTASIRGQEDMLWHPEALRDTDFRAYSLCVAYGDQCNYPTQIGLYRPLVKANLDRVAPGLVPFLSSMQHCHAVGLEFYAQFRLALHLPYSEVPFDRLPHPGYGIGGREPGCACVARNGVSVTSISYAYPQVRSHMTSLIREVADRGVDGVQLTFTRGPIYVWYEPPVVDSFKQQYGQDPRTLDDEEDERWLRHRAHYMTEFVRGVRKTLDEASRRVGHRIRLAAMVYYSEAENLLHALDARTWVQEGLIDDLLPVTKVHYMSPIKRLDLDFYREIAGGTDCRLYPCPWVHGDANTQPYHGESEDFMARAREWYQTGVDGLSFWDTPICSEELLVGMEGPLKASYRALWGALRQLGHKDELERIGKIQPPRAVALETLDGYNVAQTFRETDVTFYTRLGAG